MTKSVIRQKVRWAAKMDNRIDNLREPCLCGKMKTVNHNCSCEKIQGLKESWKNQICMSCGELFINRKNHKCTYLLRGIVS